MCHCHVVDAMFGVTVKNAFRLYDRGTDKWYLLVAGSTTQRQRWLQAFDEERRRVAMDRINGFSMDAVRRPVFNKKTTKRVRVNRQKGSILAHFVTLINKQAVRVATQYASAPPVVRTLRPTSSP